MVWLASELMFFSGLFAAYFTLRAASSDGWPPEGVELDTAVAGTFTLALVLSSLTVQCSVRAVAHGRRSAFRWWMALTMVLALVFLANQAREWASLGFSVSSHAYGSVVYVMTGFHGLHVAGGVAAMGLFLGRSTARRFGPADTPALEVVSAYWHFVDVMWLAMFAAIYLLR